MNEVALTTICYVGFIFVMFVTAIVMDVIDEKKNNK